MRNEYENSIRMRQWLSPERLRNIANEKRVTGGIVILLPDGTEIDAKVIKSAVRQMVRMGYCDFGELLLGLRSRDAYIRYASHMALMEITKERNIIYRPLICPNEKHNIEGYRCWTAICRRYYKKD
jgi:hypothetical protein